MLRIGGIINILIAIAHIVGLFWANQMFEATGVGEDMRKVAAVHPALPYVETIVVAIIFFIMGLYGLSADNKFRKLPLLKLSIFTIAGIYLFRGLGGLVYNFISHTPVSQVIFSLVATGIGLLYLLGGARKWYRKN